MNHFLPLIYFFCANWFLLSQTFDSSERVFRFLQLDMVDLVLRVPFVNRLSPCVQQMGIVGTQLVVRTSVSLWSCILGRGNLVFYGLW